MIEGFYGGKFFPMHKGHAYCIDTAANQCDHVIVIIFTNGTDELNYIKSNGITDDLQIENRIKQVAKVCSLYPNVEYKVVDVANCKYANGEEDWDAETPLVRQYVPKMDYVYSSEIGYGDYFSRAYPEATHVVVDQKRKKYPISSTLIRAMEFLEDKKEWMI